MIKKTRTSCLALATAAFLSIAAGPLLPASAFALSPDPGHAGSAAIDAFDLDRAADWYRSKLGFRLIAERNSVQGRHIVLERRGMLLELDEGQPRREDAAADVETTAATANPAALSILVGDVDAEVERLAQEGVPIASLPDDSLDGRFRVASVRDPEGRTVELREPLTGRTGETP